MVAFDATWNCRLRESGGEPREASQATGHEDVARGGEASYGVPGPVRATRTRGMRDRKSERDEDEEEIGQGKREREVVWASRGRAKNTKREREGEGEGEDQPPLLACRGLMNANHDPEAARSTCCFPVQIAYNFYCHGRNSSLMEAPAYLAPRFASRQTVFHAFCCLLLLTPSLSSISTFSPSPHRSV